MNLEDEVTKNSIKLNRIENQVKMMREDLNIAVRALPHQSKLLQYFRIGVLGCGILLGATVGGCVGAAFGQEDASGRPMFKPEGTIKPQVVQEFPQCGKTWHKQYDGLDEEQKMWFKQVRTIEYKEKDLDGDGKEDWLYLTSYPSMVGQDGGCHLGEKWYEKQNVLVYYHSNGQRQLFNWDGGLSESYKIHLNNNIADYLTVIGTEYKVEKVKINEKGGLEEMLVPVPFEKRIELR